MKRTPLILAVATALALHFSGAESDAVPQVEQIPAPVPPGNPLDTYWTRTPTGNLNEWDFTFMENPNATGGIGLALTTFTVTRPAGETVIVRNITITRPVQSGRGIILNLGVNSPVGRLQSVQSITAGPWVSGMQQGHVNVMSCNLDGNLGVVSGPNNLIGRLQSGNVIGPITCAMHPNADPASNSIDPWISEIDLESVSGDLLGNVVMQPFAGAGAVRGVIRQLKFEGGFIGRDSATAPINTVDILADGAIEQVFAKEIHARIMGTNTVPNDPTGLLDSYVRIIGHIETNRVGGASGLFTGEIRAELLGKETTDFRLVDVPLMRFTGDIQARIWLQEIQGGFIGLHDIWMPLMGLDSTIALRVLDQSIPLSTAWAAPVILTDSFATNPSPSDPNDIIFDSGDAGGYTPPRTAASIGGGTAGLAPFTQHPEDSFPVTPTTPLSSDGVPLITDMNARPSTPQPIEMRHYGPVTWDMTAGLLPYKIERRRVYDCPTTGTHCFSSSAGGCLAGPECWTDETPCFDQEPDPDPLTNGTIVLLKPKQAGSPLMDRSLQRGFEYRITRNTKPDGSNVLRSDLPHLPTVGTPPTPIDPGVADYPPFIFRICNTPALGDANDDGFVTFADITSVLASYGSGPPAFCLWTGDADRDGDRDFADITAVLANFNGPPYCTTTGQSINPSADGFAAMDLDQTEAPTTLASTVMFITDALNQMGYASISAFGDALAQMDEPTRNAEINRLGQLLEGTP